MNENPWSPNTIEWMIFEERNIVDIHIETPVELSLLIEKSSAVSLVSKTMAEMREEIEARRLESASLDGIAHAENHGYLNALRDILKRLEALQDSGYIGS